MRIERISPLGKPGPVKIGFIQASEPFHSPHGASSLNGQHSWISDSSCETWKIDEGLKKFLMIPARNFHFDRNERRGPIRPAYVVWVK